MEKNEGGEQEENYAGLKLSKALNLLLVFFMALV